MKSEFLPTDNRGMAATAAAAPTRRAKPDGGKKEKKIGGKNALPRARKNDRNVGADDQSRMGFAVSFRARACIRVHA